MNNSNKEDQVEMLASSGSAYDHHIEHCPACRANPFGACPEADRSLRDSVRSGNAREFDRQLDRVRNGPIDDSMED